LCRVCECVCVFLSIPSILTTSRTSATGRPLKFESDELNAAVVMLNRMSPSTHTSSKPVTVTVCEVFHTPGANVKDQDETAPSPVSVLDAPMVTLTEG
jgi:hypothetical protein